MNLLTTARKRLGRIKRFLFIKALCARTKKEDILHFTCNICGRSAAYPVRALTREGNSCYYCGSTVRLRSVIHALSMELFDKSLIIDDFPSRPDITGIGLSDWDGYATRLEKKLGYTNTFYHQKPFLDVSSDDAPTFGKFDFILCSDVFEHVAPPVSKAFKNLHGLLKPNGVLIFSVPYREGETTEHFPELGHYSMRKEGGEYVIDNETADGRHQRFTNLTFHGGPGTVVEMRIFGKDSLNKDFLQAGFEKPTIHSEEVMKFGIVWNSYVPEDAPYRPLIFALDTPPWAVRTAAE